MQKVYDDDDTQQAKFWSKKFPWAFGLDELNICKIGKNQRQVNIKTNNRCTDIRLNGVTQSD